jgi:hypothetical protein
MLSDIFITLSKDVLCEQLNDEVVLLDMRSGFYFGLTPVASRFWLALDRGETASEAATEVLTNFNVSRTSLERDLLALIAKLAEHELITFTNYANAA